MNIEAIYQNADVINVSKSGEINRVMISRDEYDFLCDYTNNENRFAGFGDDIVELDYHNEFVPIIEQARERFSTELEIEKEVAEENRAWKAANRMYEDDEENFYNG